MGNVPSAGAKSFVVGLQNMYGVQYYETIFISCRIIQSCISNRCSDACGRWGSAPGCAAAASFSSAASACGGFRLLAPDGPVPKVGGGREPRTINGG
jgi:hypothetical protein